MSACETCQGSGLRSPVDDGCDVYRTAACPSCLGTGTTYYRPCYYCRRPRGNDHQDGCTCNTCLRDVCWGINEDCVATRAVAIETCQALANIGTGVLIAHLAEIAENLAEDLHATATMRRAHLTAQLAHLTAQLAHAEADAEQAIHNEAFKEAQRIAEWLRTTSRAKDVLISVHSGQDIARLADDVASMRYREPT